MPNAKALGVNAHFFNLRPCLTLPISLGVCLFPRPAQDGLSLRFDPRDPDRFLPLLAQFGSAAGDNGLFWDETRLFERLSRPAHDYGLHVAGDLLLISSCQETRGIRHTLLCGFPVRPGRRTSQKELDEAVRAACLMWGRRLYIYVGTNDKLPKFPGLRIPEKIRPSPMLLQLRDFRPDQQPPFRLDRYELIDFDYA